MSRTLASCGWRIERNVSAIHVQVVDSLCDFAASRFVLKATVYKSKSSSGFVGYGDADPSKSRSSSAAPRCAWRRLARSTVLCAKLMESASARSRRSAPSTSPQPSQESKKLPPQPANGDGNRGSPKVRDRLCQLIRQHQLDPNLVKAYATDFCGVKALRDATREQVENFVKHLADWAEKDRNALLCQLNSYLGQKEGAA